MKGKRGPASHEFGSAPTTIMEPPQVVLPDDQLFSRRALRLRELMVMVPALDEFSTSWRARRRPSIRS